MAKNKLNLYSVTQINAMIKGAIESVLPPRMIVRGQISDWKRHGSGHCYFLLKDADSQLPCVMWSSRFKELKFEPSNGQEILATGHLEVYVPQGKYQFYGDKLEPAGVGALQVAFEQMCAKLRAEGLFDDRHKKPLPSYPMRIGVVTSRSGAAVRDIVDSISQRWPFGRIYLFDVPVQGEGAAQKIAAAIGQANRERRLGIEVLIVGRGGGSMEDLWAFNEEAVARAIYHSKIPVISAVGHETDVTIADLVSDVRASTPTKAGVLAVPDVREVVAWLQTAQQRLWRSMHGRLETGGTRLDTILASWLFREPKGIVHRACQRADEISAALSRAARRRFSLLRDHLEEARAVIRRLEPVRLIAGETLRVHRLADGAGRGIRSVLAKKQLQLTAAENRLRGLDPRSVLGRGYSLTILERTGELVSSVGDVRIGDRIITELARQDRIISRVEESGETENNHGETEETAGSRDF